MDKNDRGDVTPQEQQAGARIRDAREEDVAQIRDVYLATYGQDYAYPQFYDLSQLKKLVYSDDIILLVAEDLQTGRILGTASVILEIGAFADLVAEFGRLAVHPDVRRRGIGRLLMEGRLQRVQDRLDLGLVDNRICHPFSQKISAAQHFVPVGCLPLKLRLAERESVVMFVRHFGDAVALRRNNPRIIPEAYELANRALSACGLNRDAIADDAAPSYPQDDQFELDQLTTEGYATLLRFQRGRVRHREIFGPLRLHYGLFKLMARHSNYLIARQHGVIIGAIGFTIDEVERAVRVFELISTSEQPVHFLIDQLLKRCREEWNIEYIEVDVSAYAPRMQRTLLELHFLPAAYIPAMVFHEVERLDALRMVRLLVPFPPTEVHVIDLAQPIVECVLQSFVGQALEPRIADAATAAVGLFQGLTKEQARRLARICELETFDPGKEILVEGQHDQKTYLVLEGEATVHVRQAAQPVGSVGPGEFLGEMALLSGVPHSATVTARTQIHVAVIRQDALNHLIRQRPDIGLVLYRNLALGMGQKLSRADHAGDGV
ncbi:MAG: GNAT family N-acetyltransferase [Planctomycetales bacterium]|nr:GNAT family N-acetyltransferase [Planctomycetales bacterium]NIM08379.1 GNAT family N-acetyltransferase [Planctomycetales bacterium]NIN07854.1 GNAT family N-acetyltransferase [Planctomycetales bacterium]NIN76983.1 GNAT family N-acetyltransferase [Planctomycetales bacterium]NIO34166.1 GNAT family N-acetyltransferase [Planctomycetales bacterium]